MLSVYDADLGLLIGMAKIVPGAIWNFYEIGSVGPPGIIGVVTDNEKIGRLDFINSSAKLVYLPADQM